MITITSKQDYTVARRYFHYLKTNVHGIKNTEHYKQLKREIRKYENKPLDEKRVIDDNGFDGFTLVYPLPDFLESYDDADEYFQTVEYIKAPQCAWDCTGARFTSWYKIFVRDSRYWCYHRICLDV